MKYTNAPIKEAVFDIQVFNINEISQGNLDEIHLLIKEKYPNKRKVFNFSSSIDLQESGSISNDTKSEFKGVIFSNKNSQKQVQYRNDGFSLNFLSPYSNWNEFFNEAVELWNIYVSILKPTKVNRIALKYINKIDIPLPINNFQDYVTNMPPIPKSLPQMYNHFFMQIQVPCEDSRYSAVITETMETPTNKIIPFILDIDVFKNVENDFEINDFNYLRDVKNIIFEDFITDNTRKLFN